MNPNLAINLDDDFVMVPSKSKKPYKPKHQTKKVEKKDDRTPFILSEIVKLLHDEDISISTKFEILNDIIVLPYFIKARYGHITGWRKREMIVELEQKMIERRKKQNPNLTDEEIIKREKNIVKSNLNPHERDVLKARLRDVLVKSEKIKVEDKYITEIYENNLISNEIKRLFDFKGTDKKQVNPEISKFEMPVYSPWIEIEESGKMVIQKHQRRGIDIYSPKKMKEVASKVPILVNHDDGLHKYRCYSNKYFNLLNSKINLSTLDSTWNIDFWLSILTALPEISVYNVEMLNLMFALYIELIRSYSTALRTRERRELNIYNDIINYSNTIFRYMSDNNLFEMNYCHYAEWPIDVRVAMDAITEGELKFYFGANEFHKIMVHGLSYDSPEEIINYIIKLVYNADVAEGEYFELKNEKCINDKIIKLIYNALRLPREVDIKLNSINLIGHDNQVYQKYYNKIGIMSEIFKYIIGLSRRFEKPFNKINRFGMLWNVVKNYNFKYCDNCIINEEIEYSNINRVFSIVESEQENLLVLLQTIGYELLLSIVPDRNENNLLVYFNQSQINILEEFVNENIENIIDYSKLFKLPLSCREWIDYISGKNVYDIPYKYNYTPIKIFRKYMNENKLTFDDLPFALKNNEGFKSIVSKLIYMETPINNIGYPVV